VPLFQRPDGEPQLTGWTGYDCSTPVCVQAAGFRLNVDTSDPSNADLPPSNSGELISLGGHGKDGSLECSSERCNFYNKMVTQNDGRSFQTGCGYDPIDTGCCIENNINQEEPFSADYLYICYACREGSLRRRMGDNSVQCENDDIAWEGFTSAKMISSNFINEAGRIQKCGRLHNPVGPNDGYYVSNLPGVGLEYSNQNGLSNVTSGRFLCSRLRWMQGDYIDDAGLYGIPGMGDDNGLIPGRHVRINVNNYMRDELNPDLWVNGPSIPGEGIYECAHRGSCIGPDVCTCTDGWDGYDCTTPLCRHEQPADGVIVGCLNGGTCVYKDQCRCIQVLSVLWKYHQPELERGLTGWGGTDCSMPICVQGYHDPECNMPFAPGGEGCYRCPNNGYCVAPDVCQCDEGWSGYDCQTPVCEMVVDPVTRFQLDTVDEEKVHAFEIDPCGLSNLYAPEWHNGAFHTRGNCTLPNQCTCLCKKSYNEKLCDYYGEKSDYCILPFQDPLFRYRNKLSPNVMYGTQDCWSGYEGYVNEEIDRFTSCHLTIYEPDYITKHSVSLLSWGCGLFILCVFIYCNIKRRMHRRFVHKKIERRRRRRPAEKNHNAHAFEYKRTDMEDTPEDDENDELKKL